jgi:hypothetical protein
MALTGGADSSADASAVKPGAKAKSMVRKKHKTKKRAIHSFAFTPTGLVLAQEAVELYERLSLQRASSEPSKAAFAREMLLIVKGKLDTMSTSVGALCLMSFDYNERIALATAIQLYTIELFSSPPTLQRERKLKECERIRRFALDHF